MPYREGNALDLLEGKREIGIINDEQADQLRHWIRHGMLVLSAAVPAILLDRAEEELDRAYRGEIPELRFSCPEVAGDEIIPLKESVTRLPAKGLDLHWLSPITRDLIFAPKLRQFLELLFERRLLASQSLAFLRGSAQPYHMDTFYVAYSSPIQFAASWIALEDVTAGGGELAYLERSHKLPEHLLHGGFKSVWEAQRMTGRKDQRNLAEEYEARLADAASTHGLPEKTFLAERGDVLIWHASLAHGGKPISQHRTRKSIVTHYCPKEIAPLNWEQSGAVLRSYHNLAWYTTGYYQENQHR